MPACVCVCDRVCVFGADPQAHLPLRPNPLGPGRAWPFSVLPSCFPAHEYFISPSQILAVGFIHMRKYCLIRNEQALHQPQWACMTPPISVRCYACSCLAFLNAIKQKGENVRCFKMLFTVSGSFIWQLLLNSFRLCQCGACTPSEIPRLAGEKKKTLWVCASLN